MQHSLGRYDIAIIGMGNIFPKANNTEQYWKNILSGESYFSDMPDHLWRMGHYYSKDRSRTDKSYTKIGAFIEDFDFPFLEYRLPPASLKGVDHAQLVAMETCKEALADAGIDPRSEKLNRAVTIVGTSGVDEFAHATMNFRRHRVLDKLKIELEAQGVSGKTIERLAGEFDEKLKEYGHVWNTTTIAVGAAPASISNRLAQVFGLKGFNMTVDGACSSSLIAIDVACQSLMAGDADVAITGGVDVGLNPAIYIGFSRVEGLSLTGQSNPFDHNADGLVMGEGAGILVLKRLENAIEDGDRIRAVIRGIGSSSDGAGQAIYTPAMEGRTEVLRKTLDRADTDPAEVQYIEAHATSTVVGDANEYDSISLVYGADRPESNPLYLGSVKHQIGHLKAAAGAASVIKNVLAMEHGVVPHMPRFKKLTPGAEHANDALVIPTQTTEWKPSQDGKRVSAVTTSGFGGVNYHCILEQASSYETPHSRPEVDRRVAIVGVSLKLPGASDPETFWENISEGKDVFSKVDPKELDWEDHFDRGPVNERITTRTIGKINEHKFNPLRFKIFPKSLSQISPTQLLALDLADRLLEDAGMDFKAQKNIGASIGSMHDDYYPTIFMPMILDEYADTLSECASVDEIGREKVTDAMGRVTAALIESYPPITEHTLPGWMTNITPGRLANKLNLHGPNFAVDSACSSGISALIPATYQLMFGHVDAMITGGINRQFSDVFSSAVCQLGAVAEEVARPYDDEGAGFVIGEGGVFFLFKRLEDAKRDGDNIIAVINAISGSSEAESKTMVAPSEVAVRRSIRNTLALTDVSPSTIGVVDTHGSANKISDIVEARSLAAELRPDGTGEPVQITAIKSHIGHLYGGSGSSSLISVIQSLRSKAAPGIRNLETIRPEIADVKHLAEPRKGTMPLSKETPAGAVNSLGLGGTSYFAVVTLPEEENKGSAKPSHNGGAPTVAKSHEMPKKGIGPFLLTKENLALVREKSWKRGRRLIIDEGLRYYDQNPDDVKRIADNLAFFKLPHSGAKLDEVLRELIAHYYEKLFILTKGYEAFWVAQNRIEMGTSLEVFKEARETGKAVFIGQSHFGATYLMASALMVNGISYSTVGKFPDPVGALLRDKIGTMARKYNTGTATLLDVSDPSIDVPTEMITQLLKKGVVANVFDESNQFCKPVEILGKKILGGTGMDQFLSKFNDDKLITVTPFLIRTSDDTFRYELDRHELKGSDIIGRFFQSLEKRIKEYYPQWYFIHEVHDNFIKD